ncbi:unnamed protein product [Aureobasidium uvarum]|uniref:LysM domain-containing protein n=1 Tax=Aureobasidium uvarum TaxID=2773716 RepID=A0A9N8KAD4_9PEZI|nr:unnamed protein product [Aureobasidium uvarum]
MFSAQGSLASVLLLATCSLPALNALVLEWDVNVTSLTERSKFPGFTLGYYDDLDDLDLPIPCQNALQQKIYCDDYISDYDGEPRYRGYVDTEETSYESLWNNGTITVGAGRLWEAWNETCYYDPDSGHNCNEVINEFSEVEDIEQMPLDEMCSYCNVEHYKMMQRSAYSYYDPFYQHILQTINENCGMNNPTEIPIPLDPWTEDNISCDFGAYKIQEGDTCISIAVEHSVSSEDVHEYYVSYYGSALWTPDCDQLRAGLLMCLPQPCKIYEVQADDTCAAIEAEQHIPEGASLRTYNSWIGPDCSDLQRYREGSGGVVCVSPRSDQVVIFDEESGPSADVGSSTSPWFSTTRVPSPSTDAAASTTGSHVASLQPTGVVSMTTSGPSGAKLASQSVDNSASATQSLSGDNVSGASMVGPGRSQVVVVLAALMLSQVY